MNRSLLILLLSFLTARLLATPQCPIVTQSFQSSANGDIQDASATGWYLDRTNVPNAVYFAAKSHRLKAQTLGGEGVWYSRIFSVSGYTGFQVDAKVSSEGPLTSSEYVKVYYKLDGGPEVLIAANFGNFGTPTVTSPALTGSTVQIVIRIYNFTVGNADYYIENYDVFKEKSPCTVTSIPVSINANPSGGVLTCNNPGVTLTASTTATGSTTYSWTGPNSFTSTSSNPTVSTAGTYTVVATNSAGTGTATYTVTANNSAPNLTVPAQGQLTCSNTSVPLNCSSSTAGVTFSWTGPGGFTSAMQNPTTTMAGTYTVTVTNSSTGCIASGTALVTQNITTPVGLTTTAIPANATLTCTNTSVNFTAGAQTPNLSYSWTGPNGPIGTTSSITVSSTGTYTLRGTDPTNGCSATASSVVSQNTTAPGGVATTANPATAQVTCTHPNVVLTGSSTTTGVTYSWSGPGIVSTSGASATVNLDGTYTVTVTDPTNGCVTTLPGSVTRNVSVPIGLTASPSDVISCFTTAINLQGGSSTPGATFSWSGPGGYSATTDTAQTSTPGNYTLTVTNPTNGCSASTSTTVLADTATPANVTASNNGPITCTTTSVTISSTSSTPGVDFTWVTPSNTFIAGATAVVSVPGTYTIQVTNNGNGCVSQTTTTVIKNCPGSVAVIPGAVSGKAEGFSMDALTGFVYKTYPNPVSMTAFIEFASPVSSPVKVELYSSDGYRERLLFNNTVNANQVYKLQLGASGLSSGTHFCIIRNGDKVYSSKLILLK